MKKNYTIGIDIGGTNTDAVLIDDFQKIVAKNKVPTSAVLENGVKSVLQGLLSNAEGFDKNSVGGIFIGTTHATNAILEHKGLYRVGVLRIAGHRPDTLKCCAFWPEGLRQNIFAGCICIDGGYECDGRPITSFDRRQAEAAIKTLVGMGAEAIAICGVFSPINADQEQECEAVIKNLLGDGFPCTLSSQIGGIGFIERENAAILNCALKKAIAVGFKNIEQVRTQLGLKCPLWISQNDGSIIGLAKAMENPLLTISSGPTNSFVGASRLAGLQDAIVVDIGGTSTDIGMIQNGYPKHSMHNVNIGGVNLNFRMPDVLAYAIGGGSYIELNKDKVNIGPQSCGKKLFQESQVFGGPSLTLTDAAFAAGCMDIPQGKPISLSVEQAQKILQQVLTKVQDGIRRMKGNRKNLPVILVGGGAPFLAACPDTIVPENFNVANAYGSALAEISCTIETVVNLDDRENVLKAIREDALKLAAERGADPASTKIVDLVIIPYHYMPNNLARVSVKASGKRNLK